MKNLRFEDCIAQMYSISLMPFLKRTSKISHNGQQVDTLIQWGVVVWTLHIPTLRNHFSWKSPWIVAEEILEERQMPLSCWNHVSSLHSEFMKSRKIFNHVDISLSVTARSCCDFEKTTRLFSITLHRDMSEFPWATSSSEVNATFLSLFPNFMQYKETLKTVWISLYYAFVYFHYCFLWRKIIITYPTLSIFLCNALFEVIIPY